MKGLPWEPGVARLPWSPKGLPLAQMVKNLPAVQETQVQYLGWEDPLEKGKAAHSSILAWEIPWIEKPSGLWSTEPKQLDMTE